jgi:hypothetical protein
MHQEEVVDVAETVEEPLIELGSVSSQTKGLFFGSIYEISILPLRLI